MATSEPTKPSSGPPIDLLPIIRDSGVLSDRVFAEIKAKVLSGDYPYDAQALARRLVEEKLLTDYQSQRFLKNKSHGLVVGRYVILDRLGAGSMGRVYKAQHQMMERIVALKIIAPEIASNDKVTARFQREMKLVGRLDHPNVVRAFDADQLQKILYIVMEYVPGKSLAQRLREGLIAPDEIVDFAAQAASGLAHAHAQGIVHRDIKPSNLLLTEGGRLKVLDLGLGVLMEADNSTSFATADGIAVGTIDYMSPEQACGRDVDGRSDLFSLGCSMYHLMTGRLPFPGATPLDRLGKRIKGSPVPIHEVRADVPAGLVKVMDRLLANRPQDRFQTAEDAVEAFQALLRPRSRSSQGGGALPPKAVKEPSPVPNVELPSPPPLVERIEPDFPSWFRPFARLAESKPVVALLALLGVVSLAFGSGFALGWLLRQM
jgi:serine/threonine protein kinase